MSKYLDDILETWRREFMCRLALYIIAIGSTVLVAWVTSTDIGKTAILSTLLSATLEIISRIWSLTIEMSNKIEELKPTGVVEILKTEDAVKESLRKIVDAAKTGDTIYVSADKAPEAPQEADPSGHYYLIKKRAMQKDITLRRLVYVARFEDDDDKYKERLKDLKDWIEKDRKDIEKQYEVAATRLPHFFYYIYLEPLNPCEGKRIFQMSIPPFEGHPKRALYVEGHPMLEAFSKEISEHFIKALAEKTLDSVMGKI